MKKILICLFLSFAFFCSYAQQIFLKKKPSTEKVAVAFGEPTPSALFFGVDDGSIAFKRHKLNNQKVNAYFGAVYSNFPIFDIGKEHIVEYINANGKFFFYRPNVKRPFGIVISNGKDKPILETNPELYLKQIKVYLNIGNADYLVPKTLDAQNERSAQEEMRQILNVNFIPDQNYTTNLIKNASSVHYMKPYDDGNYKMNCRKRIFEMFGDSLMTTKSAYGATYIYNDKNEMEYMANTVVVKETGYSKYEREEHGLIRKIISGDENSADTTLFVYNKDKYHTVSLSHGKPYSFETFFLNDQMQCVRRLSKRSDQSLIWDITYIYDKFGRVIREGQLNSEIIYQYKNESDLLFSGFSSFSLNPRKLNFQNEIIREKNKQTFIGFDGNGNQNSKSITYTAKDGSTKTYSYDKDNKITSVSVVRCD